MDKSNFPAQPGVNVANPNPDSPTNYPLDFTSIAPVFFTVNGGTASFVDLNVGGALPADAQIVDVLMAVTITGPTGVRPAGSALARTLPIGVTVMLQMSVECGTRHIEVFDPALGTNTFALLGYWS